MLINVKGDSDQLNGVLADYLYKVGRRCKSQAFCGFVLWFRCPVKRVLLSSIGNRKYSRLKNDRPRAKDTGEFGYLCICLGYYLHPKQRTRKTPELNLLA